MFRDRTDAGRFLAARLLHLRGRDVIVLGLPRGGVPVAREVADVLDAPLDVIVVRKLGVPWQPELAMGAIGEDDVRVIDEEIVHQTGVSPERLAAVEAAERAELARRVQQFRADRPRAPLAGREVVVVDDGIATGATARAACQVARAEGARRVVLAVPVAPPHWERRFTDVADELVCVATPSPFRDIGRFYGDFSQTTDDEVLAALAASAATAGPPAGPLATAAAAPAAAEPADDPAPADEDVEIPLPGGDVVLKGHLRVPAVARGLVVFVHGSGSSRHSPRNQYVARVMDAAGFATLLFDLLTPAEETDRGKVFDVELLARRLDVATTWVRGRPDCAALPLGYFGASTGAAAALLASIGREDVAAVVSRGGRPDLAGTRLGQVRAPTLLIVGGEDSLVLKLNQRALIAMRGEVSLAVVPGATHLFEEPGALQTAAGLARDWFTTRLSRRPAVRGR